MRIRCLFLAVFGMVLGPVAAAPQTPAPSATVRAGTPEVPIPALADPAPAQRRWLLDLSFMGTSAADVTLEASVARDGSVEDVRILSPERPPDRPRPEPTRDRRDSAVFIADVGPDDDLRSLLDDVRAMVLQWRFAPTLVDGVATPVVVQVRLRLELAPWPEPSFFPERLDPTIEATVPSDFALVYVFGTCELDTRAGTIRQAWPARQISRAIDFQLSAAERQAIYAELLRVGFFEYPQLQRGYIPRDEAPQVLVDRGATALAVTIRGRLSGYAINTGPSRSVAVFRQDQRKSVSWIENDEVNRFVSPPMAGMYADGAIVVRSFVFPITLFPITLDLRETTMASSSSTGGKVVARKKRLSVEEYFELPEGLSPMELLAGVVREPPAPRYGHQSVVTRLTTLLDAHVRVHGAGRVCVSPIDVVLDREVALVVQPDIVFIATSRLHIIDERIWGPPDLAVEVLSRSTANRDRTTKLEWYRRYGVAEAWLVDPVDYRVTVVSFSTQPEQRTPFTGDVPMVSAVLPHWRLSAADIFVP